MGQFGFPFPIMVVWAITATEIVAGLLLITNRHVKLACLALGPVAFGGIVLIHARLGWWVGEHGAGGSEYSVALLTLLLLIAARDRETVSRLP
jgi:putative oxidoreductase